MQWTQKECINYLNCFIIFHTKKFTTIAIYNCVLNYKRVISSSWMKHMITNESIRNLDLMITNWVLYHFAPVSDQEF